MVDWYNSYGQRKARLWLDAKIGIVLRLQQFGGRDSRTIINDMIVTELTLDQNFPPSRLAAEMQQVKSSEAQGPGAAAKVILPTPTAAIPITQRQSLTMTSLPKDYNLPASELFFQFSNNPQTSNALSDTAKIPAQIFADRYFVASTKFGLPWMLRCRRSPDGYRLAFNTGSDGTSTPDDSLLWLDLRYPDQLFEPFPELHAQAFAFSPDNTRIAVFGFGPNKEASGIFIIDLSKVENRVLFELPEAHSLVWNPDGESLALVGKLSQDGFQEAAVIHIRTGQISFHAPFPEGLSHIPESWPMANWGLPFPQTNDGMDDCSRPAQ